MKRILLKTFHLTAFVLCCCMGKQAMAQTPISLKEALNYALNNSEVIKQAKLDIQNAHQKVLENKANAYPQIRVTSSLTGNPIVQQFVLPAEAFGGAPGEFSSIKVGQNWNAFSQVRLSQQVYNQQLFTAMKAAKSSVELYEIINEASEENVIQIVAANFLQVLISEEKLKVIDANIERMEALEEMMQGQFDAGLVKGIDLERIKVNKSNLKTQKLSLKNAVAQQKNLLKYYMGMPVDEDIVLENSLAENSDKMALLDESDPVSLEQLNSFRILKKQEELLNLQKKVQKAEAYPSLVLDGNYTYNTQSEHLDIYSKKALNYDVSSINLTLSIPIFDGFSRRARIKQTDIARQQLQQDQRKTLNELKMNLTNSKEQMNISFEAIQDQVANIALAQNVFNSTQNNYKNGLAPLTDLLDAETELVNAQNGYHEAVLNYKIAEIEYLKSQGKIKSLTF